MRRTPHPSALKGRDTTPWFAVLGAEHERQEDFGFCTRRERAGGRLGCLWFSADHGGSAYKGGDAPLPKASALLRTVDGPPASSQTHRQGVPSLLELRSSAKIYNSQLSTSDLWDKLIAGRQTGWRILEGRALSRPQSRRPRQGQDIPAQGNALGMRRTPHPSALKGRDTTPWFAVLGAEHEMQEDSGFCTRCERAGGRLGCL